MQGTFRLWSVDYPLYDIQIEYGYSRYFPAMGFICGRYRHSRICLPPASAAIVIVFKTPRITRPGFT